MDTRKRGRGEFGLNGNGGFKRSKPELDSLSSGIGSKSKPCTKFFSDSVAPNSNAFGGGTSFTIMSRHLMSILAAVFYIFIDFRMLLCFHGQEISQSSILSSGCPFGDNCHFLHYFPGGYKAVSQMMNLVPPVNRTVAGPPAIQNGSAPAGVKTKICNRFNSSEGCKFGDKCNFAHGEWELGKPIMPSHEDPRAVGAIAGRFNAPMEPPVPGSAAGFGLSATAKISVDASLVGAIIGKGGVNSKQICRQTGAKLAIRDHEANPNLRNIELEGTFEQIQQASTMVREIIVTVSSGNGSVKAMGAPGGGPPPTPGSNYKTKLCENFSKGSCTFGDRCHFAHGAAELRKTGL